MPKFPEPEKDPTYSPRPWFTAVVLTEFVLPPSARVAPRWSWYDQWEDPNFEELIMALPP